jgi:DNA-binding CsgD family transcriptional regulator
MSITKIKYKGVYFTRRELDCVKELIRGKTIKMIARTLDVSPRTIEHHLENIRSKACCNTKSELVGWLLNNGIFTILLRFKDLPDNS